MQRSIKSALVVAAGSAVLLVVAGPASASTVNGTVVHRNGHAHSFVVAARHGHLKAIHARHAPALGRRVKVKARRLRNGTFAARHIRVHGRRSQARIRGTVSFVDRSHHAFVVSARGASIRVQRLRHAHGASAASDELPSVGSVVEVEASLDDQGELETDDVQEIGEDRNGIEIEGVVLSVDTTNRTIEVSADDDDETGQSVLVHVPDAIDLGAFQSGQEVELTVSRSSDGYVLQSTARDDDADEADNPDNEQGDDGQGEDTSGDGGIDD